MSRKLAVLLIPLLAGCCLMAPANKANVERIASSKFWEKPRTPAEIEAVVSRIQEAHAGEVVKITELDGEISVAIVEDKISRVNGRTFSMYGETSEFSLTIRPTYDNVSKGVAIRLLRDEIEKAERYLAANPTRARGQSKL